MGESYDSSKDGKLWYEDRPVTATSTRTAPTRRALLGAFPYGGVTIL